MALSLRSEDCSTVSEASNLFATEKGLLVLRPDGDGCCGCFHFQIPSGMYALVTRHGADEDHEQHGAVWPAGLHFPYPPWVKVSHLVTQQTIVLDMPVKGCKTKDNVTVQIDISINFRIMGDESKGEDPELVRKFVHQVTPRGLEQQLRDAQEESVRSLARSLKHTEVFGVRSGLHDASIIGDELSDEDGPDRDAIFQGSSDQKDAASAKRAVTKGVDITDAMVKSLNKQFVPQGVEIESVAIKDVSLPRDITKQMFEKTMIVSRNAQQTMYHENQVQLTRMNEEVQTMLQTFLEEREAEEAAGAKAVNTEQVKLADAKADATKVEASIREETKVRIQNIKAESDLEVQRVNDSMNASLVKVDTEARREAAEIEANTNLEVQTMLAEAQLEKTRNEAKAEQLLAKAEGTIAPWIEKKKEFETKQKMLEVFEKLSGNNDVIVSGSSDEGVNLSIVADAMLQSSSLFKEENRSALMAELALLSQGSNSFVPDRST